MVQFPLTATVNGLRSSLSIMCAALDRRQVVNRQRREQAYLVFRPVLFVAHGIDAGFQYTLLLGCGGVFAAAWILRAAMAVAALLLALYLGAVLIAVGCWAFDGMSSTAPVTPSTATYTTSDTASAPSHPSYTPQASSYSPPPVYSCPPPPPATTPDYVYTGDTAREKPKKGFLPGVKEYFKENGPDLLMAAAQMALQKGGPPPNQGKVSVSGYQRSDGTVVRPYERSYPKR